MSLFYWKFNRKTERQKDRKTERQKDRKTERQKDKEFFNYFKNKVSVVIVFFEDRIEMLTNVD